MNDAIPALAQTFDRSVSVNWERFPFERKYRFFSGGKPNGTGLPTGNFSKKGNTFGGIYLLTFLPELPENHSTIYFITLVHTPW